MKEGVWMAGGVAKIFAAALVWIWPTRLLHPRHGFFDKAVIPQFVIPAQAGISARTYSYRILLEIPACAGMTAGLGMTVKRCWGMQLGEVGDDILKQCCIGDCL